MSLCSILSGQGFISVGVAGESSGFRSQVGEMHRPLTLVSNQAFNLSPPTHH